MAAGDEQDLIEAVVTCEGNLHDPDFQDKFRTLVDKLKTALYISKTKDPFRVRKIEPWNSVRVTISIPKEAAQKLKLLAQQGSNVLRSMGILSVQVEGDQVISLTWAAQNNEATQVILRQTSDEPAGSSGTSGVSSSSLPASSPSISSISSSVASISSPIPLTPGPSGDPSGMAVSLDMLSSSSSSSSASTLAFRSPNVVAPGGEAIPVLPPKGTATGARPAALGGPFPFVSMTHAAQAIQRSEQSPMLSSNNIVVSNSGSNAANSTNSVVSSVLLSTSQGTVKSLQQSPLQSNLLPVTISSNNSSSSSTCGAPVNIVSTSSTVNVNSEQAQVTRLIIENSSLVNSPTTSSQQVVVGSNVASVGISGTTTTTNNNSNIALSHAGPSHQSLQLQLVNVPPPYPGVTTISSNHSLSSSSSSSHHLNIHHSSSNLITGNVHSRHPHPQQLSSVGATTTSIPPSSSSTLPTSAVTHTTTVMDTSMSSQTTDILNRIPTEPATNVSDSSCSSVSPTIQPVASPLLVNLLQNNDIASGNSSTSGPPSSMPAEQYNQQQKLLQQQKNAILTATSVPGGTVGGKDNLQAKYIHQQQSKKTKRGLSLDGASSPSVSKTNTVSLDSSVLSVTGGLSTTQKTSNTAPTTSAESFQFALPLPSSSDAGPGSAVTMNRVNVPIPPASPDNGKMGSTSEPSSTSAQLHPHQLQGRTIVKGNFRILDQGSGQVRSIPIQQQPLPPPPYPGAPKSTFTVGETSSTAHHNQLAGHHVTLPNGPISASSSSDGGNDHRQSLATVTLVQSIEQQQTPSDASSTAASPAADQSRTLLPITTVNIVSKSPSSTSKSSFNVNSNINNNNSSSGSAKDSDTKTFIPPPDPRLVSSQVQKLSSHSSATNNSVSAKNSTSSSNLVVQATTGYNSDAKSSTSQLHHPHPMSRNSALWAKRLGASSTKESSNAFVPRQIQSPGKPRQFLINPLTGHLEPLPSESSSESEEGDESNADSSESGGRLSGKSNSHHGKSSLSKNKFGKGGIPQGFHHRQIVTTTETGVTVARVIKTSSPALDPNIAQSFGESLEGKNNRAGVNSTDTGGTSSASVMSVSKKPREDLASSVTTSTSAALYTNSSRDSKDNSSPSPGKVTATSVAGESIKLRLKLEKSEPISPAYKVDVSFVKKSEKSSVLPASSGMSSIGGSSSSSMSSSSGFSPSQPSSSVSHSQSSSVGDQPRVPPLHISLRGKNAAVVVSPRREEKDMPPPAPLSSSAATVTSGITKESLVNLKDSTASSENHPLSTYSSSKIIPPLLNSHEGKFSSTKSSGSTKRVKNKEKSVDITGGSEKVKAKMSRPKLSKEVSTSRQGSSSSPSSSSTVDDDKDSGHLTMPVLQPAVTLPILEQDVVKDQRHHHGTKANILVAPDPEKSDVTNPTVVAEKGITSLSDNAVKKKEAELPVLSADLTKRSGETSIFSSDRFADVVHDLKEGGEGLSSSQNDIAVKKLTTETPIPKNVPVEEPKKNFESSVTKIKIATAATDTKPQEKLLPPTQPGNPPLGSVSSKAVTAVSEEIATKVVVPTLQPPQVKQDTFKGAFSSSSSSSSADAVLLSMEKLEERPASIEEIVSPGEAKQLKAVEVSTTSVITKPDNNPQLEVISTKENDKKDETVVSPVISLSTTSCDINTTTECSTEKSEEREKCVEQIINKTGFESKLSSQQQQQQSFRIAATAVVTPPENDSSTGATTTTTPVDAIKEQKKSVESTDDVLTSVEEKTKEDAIEKFPELAMTDNGDTKGAPFHEDKQKQVTENISKSSETENEKLDIRPTVSTSTLECIVVSEEKEKDPSPRESGTDPTTIVDNLTESKKDIEDSTKKESVKEQPTQSLDSERKQNQSQLMEMDSQKQLSSVNVTVQLDEGPSTLSVESKKIGMKRKRSLSSEQVSDGNKVVKCHQSAELEHHSSANDNSVPPKTPEKELLPIITEKEKSEKPPCEDTSKTPLEKTTNKEELKTINEDVAIISKMPTDNEMKQSEQTLPNESVKESGTGTEKLDAFIEKPSLVEKPKVDSKKDISEHVKVDKNEEVSGLKSPDTSFVVPTLSSTNAASVEPKTATVPKKEEEGNEQPLPISIEEVRDVMKCEPQGSVPSESEHIQLKDEILKSASPEQIDLKSTEKSVVGTSSDSKPTYDVTTNDKESNTSFAEERKVSDASGAVTEPKRLFPKDSTKDVEENESQKSNETQQNPVEQEKKTDTPEQEKEEAPKFPPLSKEAPCPSQKCKNTELSAKEGKTEEVPKLSVLPSKTEEAPPKNTEPVVINNLLGESVTVKKQESSSMQSEKHSSEVDPSAVKVPLKLESKSEVDKAKKIGVKGSSKLETETNRIVKEKAVVHIGAPQLVSVESSTSVPKLSVGGSEVSPVTEKQKETVSDSSGRSSGSVLKKEKIVSGDVNVTVMTPRKTDLTNVSVSSNAPPPISIVLPSSVAEGKGGGGVAGTKNTYKRRAEIKPGALQNTLKRLHDNFLPKVLKTSEKQDALTQASKTSIGSSASANVDNVMKVGAGEMIASSSSNSSGSGVPAGHVNATHGKQSPLPTMNKSVSIAIPQVRPIPNLLQRPKLSTAATASVTGGNVPPSLHQIPSTLQSNILTAVSTAISSAGLTSVASLSVASSAGGQPQTVFAIHPNVSIPANFAQLQQSPSVVLPGGHKMVPIKLVTLPKQSSGQLQTIPLGGATPNRSSPNLLEAVNIVANAGSRSSSPKTTLISNTMQSTPLNLSSMSLPVGGNLHFVPISVSSAAGTAGNVKVLMTQPIKMQQAGLGQSMVVKSVLMGNQPATIRVIRPANLPDQISLQNLIKQPATDQGGAGTGVNKVANTKSSDSGIILGDTSARKSEFTPTILSSESLFKKLDGVEIVETGSPLNNDELGFEADIIHDEKDLEDVLAAEAIKEGMTTENCVNFHVSEVEPEKPNKSSKPILISTPASQSLPIQNHVGVQRRFLNISRTATSVTEAATTPDSPAPVMRVGSPHFTYSSSKQAKERQKSRSRSPSPVGPDLHGEDEEIINSFSRSPSQPRLSPQLKPTHVFESNESGGSRSDHTYGIQTTSTSSLGMANCDNSNRLGQELSIEIPPIDMEVALSPSSQHPPEGKRCTRSTRSNPRLSPDITAFVSSEPSSKPNKSTTAAKVELMALRSSPKPSPTGSLKVLSPTPSSLTITPSTSTRSSPILHNQHQINANNAAATINAVAMGIIDKIQGNATAQNAKNARISKLSGVGGKRKRQESDSSSASRDENMDDKTELDLNSRPGKRKCSENAAEMIKVCIGVEDSPKRNSSTGTNKKTDSELKLKDAKGKKTMTPLLEEDDDVDSEVSAPRSGRSGRSSRESSEDRSSSRGSSTQRVVSTTVVNEKSKSTKEKDEDVPSKEIKSSRLNSRMIKEAAAAASAKSKSVMQFSERGSPHHSTNSANTTPAAKKTKLESGSGKATNTPRRAAHLKKTPNSKNKSSPLTPAKTRTNVRGTTNKEGGVATSHPSAHPEKNATSSSLSSSSSTTNTSGNADNENARRKTRSSAAGKRHAT